jgi:hypothetical protein
VFQIHAGAATREQLEAAFANIVKGGFDPYETRATLAAICCNDEAPQSLLEEVLLRGEALALAAWERRSSRRRRPRACAVRDAKQLTCAVMASLMIHPNTSADSRERLFKNLRRRHVDIDTIRRQSLRGRLEITYETSGGDKRTFEHTFLGRRRRARRFRRTVKALRARAGVLDRMAVRLRRQARTLQRKLAEKKRRKKKR